MEDIESYLKIKLKYVDALLPMSVYSKLYMLVKSERPSNILEIGTAHGAGTIAMALSCVDNDISCHIDTIDVFEESEQIPSSRSKFGDKNKNVEIVKEHFQKSGVDAIIKVFVGTSDLFFSSKIIEKKYDFVVIDADGRIDRDLIHLQPFLRKSSIIVIDDIDGSPQMQNPLGKMRIDLKHVITRKLVNAMIENDLIAELYHWDKTGVYRAKDPAKWKAERIHIIALNCYRELIFVNFDIKTTLKAMCLQFLKTNKILLKTAILVKRKLKL